MTERATDFDDWIVETFGSVGSFTMLIVLVEISETTVSPMASSYLHIIGDETRWSDMVELFAGSGAEWNGAVFYRADRNGLIDDVLAKQRLQSLTRHLEGDRSLIKHGEFFDRRGLRMMIEEASSH